MTAYADVELAVSAVKAGAADFITKPWKIINLKVWLRRLMVMHSITKKSLA